MSTSKAEFLKLSVAERIKLVGDIWDSIAADAPDALELTEAQRRELKRRLAAHDADPDSGVPWPQVRDELLPRDE
jgi:putative addiction module component (TIGR02574 family)